MATASATVSNLRIDDQAVAFTVEVEGAPGAKGMGVMIVYDAEGVERSRTDLGEMPAGQRWDAWLELPASTLADGDYTVWVFVSSDTSEGGIGGGDSKGASFLVGRGRIYPSGERPAERETSEPPALSPLRLEGSWIVVDMTNKNAYDMPVAHSMIIGQEAGTFQEFHGRELLQARATQQAHYLLPEALADGKYLVVVSAQREGSDFPNLAQCYILVDGGVLTLVPQ